MPWADRGCLGQIAEQLVAVVPVDQELRGLVFVVLFAVAAAPVRTAHRGHAHAAHAHCAAADSGATDAGGVCSRSAAEAGSRGRERPRRRAMRLGR
ncbi:hypothetical protein S7W_12509 [Mycobacteroides abscessus M94]|nr:hypothetical protein S7W_12509 [Mycobacteroides abscessus M94]